MGKTIKKRERNQNWTKEEKEFLKDTIGPYSEIIDSKVNNTSMIAKKNECWAKISNDMNSIGIDLPVEKLKGQWMRMKTYARTTISNYRREVNTTGGGPQPKEPDPIDYEIQEMLPNDFEDDEANFDSDAHFAGNAGLNEVKKEPPSEFIPKQHPSKKKATLSGQDVLQKRLEQIEKEMTYQKEIFEMQVQISRKQIELLDLQIKNEKKNLK